MAIKFQYNKTSLQQLEKQLQMRERSLNRRYRATKIWWLCGMSSLPN